jgi:hypothetical protein
MPLIADNLKKIMLGIEILEFGGSLEPKSFTTESK